MAVETAPATQKSLNPKVRFQHVTPGRYGTQEVKKVLHRPGEKPELPYYLGIGWNIALIAYKIEHNGVNAVMTMEYDFRDITVELDGNRNVNITTIGKDDDGYSNKLHKVRLSFEGGSVRITKGNEVISMKNINNFFDPNRDY